ncbi:MAG: hypothetical protein ABIA75_04650 [Candidatus Neomarinimicrobiota bacterium]
MVLTQTRHNLTQLLNQERDCFRTILAESQKILDCSSGSTTDSIYDLLTYRQQKIAELRELESHVQGLYEGDPYSYVQPDTIDEEIATMAKILIGVDAKIMDILQSLKVKCVSEISNLKERQKNMSNLASRKQVSSKLINILQE